MSYWEIICLPLVVLLAAAHNRLAFHLICQRLEPRWQLLLGFDDQVREVAENVAVFIVEKRSCQSWN